MKPLFDFFPIVLFFLAYKFYDIYTATIVLMIAATIQTGIIWFKYRKLEFTHILTLTLALMLGAATLFFHDELFIKWKPTAIYWTFAILFFGSQLIGNKPFIQYMLGTKINLPKNIWQRLNVCWAIFFSLMGGINIYVAYNFSTDIWVNFKLFGTLGGTLVFGILQSLYIAKYLKNFE